VVVRAGDVATGIEDAWPHSRYPRGGEGRRQARQRIVQPQLVLPVRVGPGPRREAGALNYALLHCFDLKQGVVRAELSVPADLDSRGVVVDWHKRIILPSFEPDGGQGAIQTPAPAPTPPVEVRRRSA
jgi:hypothetical protein